MLFVLTAATNRRQNKTFDSGIAVFHHIFRPYFVTACMYICVCVPTKDTKRKKFTFYLIKTIKLFKLLYKQIYISEYIYNPIHDCSGARSKFQCEVCSKQTDKRVERKRFAMV